MDGWHTGTILEPFYACDRVREAAFDRKDLDMAYTFRFRAASYFGGDLVEGRKYAGWSMEESTETFNADSDDDALLKAVKIMQEKTRTEEGKTYQAEAISLHKNIDILTLYRGR